MADWFEWQCENNGLKYLQTRTFAKSPFFVYNQKSQSLHRYEGFCKSFRLPENEFAKQINVEILNTKSRINWFIGFGILLGLQTRFENSHITGCLLFGQNADFTLWKRKFNIFFIKSFPNRHQNR